MISMMVESYLNEGEEPAGVVWVTHFNMQGEVTNAWQIGLPPFLPEMEHQPPLQMKSLPILRAHPYRNSSKHLH